MIKQESIHEFKNAVKLRQSKKDGECLKNLFYEIYMQLFIYQL